MTEQPPDPLHGHRDALCAARHGTATPRGLDPVGAARGGRFGRMFPELPACELTDDTIDQLVAGMNARHQPNPRIPSGYTYLGQFIDHDITFDPQSSLERANDPHALTNFRTPRFDLDSLYGSGPDDQPFLYDWGCEPDRGVKLLVGHNSGKDEAGVDLPRNSEGRALIGDARNDENLIISQLHLLFIRFHNKVVDRLRCHPPPNATGTLFEEAQRVVRWHYQWIVVHDFLARIVGKAAYEKLQPRADGTTRATQRWLWAWRDEPAIPVEFSSAAYRFGHSMVRGGYRAKRTTEPEPIFRPHGDDGLSFSGFRRLPCALEIEWDLFFFDRGPGPENPGNFSHRLDTSLVAPLFHLPPDNASLARLNLRRGRALGLPSGPAVARAMGIPPLKATQVNGISGVTAETVAHLQGMIDVLPLWVYVLLEAKVLGGDGLNLGSVGGGIVSEVLLGLLEADPNAYLQHRPMWRPELCDDFTMLDLVRYVNDPDWL